MTEKIRQRDLSLDIMKTILVIGMIAAHVLQLDTRLKTMPSAVRNFSWYIDLVTFSGFLFCFGCAAWIAYIGRENTDRKRIFKNALRLYAGYLIAGVAYQVLYAGQPFWNSVVETVTFKVLPEYCEFLLTFILINLTVGLFLNSWRKSLEKPWIFIAVCIVCLGATFIPRNTFHNVFAGLLIGCDTFYCFPLIQYLPMFLLGLWCGAHGRKASPLVWGIGIAASAASIAIAVHQGHLPRRFPPVLASVCMPSAAILVYWWLSRLAGRAIKNAGVRKFFEIFGRNALDFLVISNVLIFAAASLFGKDMNLAQAACVFVFIMAVCVAEGYTRDCIRRRNHSSTHPSAH